MPVVQSNDTGHMLSSPVTVEDGGSTGKAEATQGVAGDDNLLELRQKLVATEAAYSTS